MEKEIFSYCFSIKVKQKSGSTKYHNTYILLSTPSHRVARRKGPTGPTEGNRNISSQQ